MSAGTATSPGDAALRGGVRQLLFPRSAVLVGASDRTAAQAAAVRNAAGRDVRVHGVHPTRAEVVGVPCARRVADLDDVPELALLLVGHERVEPAFEEAAEAGVRAFVLPGLGNEAGAAGREIAARVAVRAAELGCAVLGPNCMGVARPDGASFWIGTIPETFVAGRVACVVQSGSIGEALTALGPRVGFRCVVSSGGEAVRDVADLCAFLAADEGTGAVGLFVEAVRRPAALGRALERLAEAEKPVVCLKVGHSRAGASAAHAHTGAVVGSRRAFSALLRRYGAIEVDDFHDLVETLEVLGRRRRPRGTRLAAVSESGGECALLADEADAAGAAFPPLPTGLAERLRAEFPNFVTPQNPLDAWAVDAVERVYPRSFELLARSGAFDVLLAQIDLSQFRGRAETEWCLLVAGALANAVEGTDVFPAVTSVQASDPPPEAAALARERDLALLRGTGHAVRALAAVARWRPVRPPRLPAYPPVDLADLLRPGGLPEHESMLALERYGVRFPPRRRAAGAAEAARAAEELGSPVVVKLDGPAHKSARGGVLFAEGPEGAAAAAERLAAPVLVARRLPPGPEAFCGVTRDSDFGPVLAVGLGGAALEALSLAAVALAPLDAAAARTLVEEAPGLASVASEAAREDVATALVALGRLAREHPEVEAADLNPLILSANGATAVDALVVVGGETA